MISVFLDGSLNTIHDLCVLWAMLSTPMCTKWGKEYLISEGVRVRFSKACVSETL